MAHYAIGDIHGCYTALTRLLQHIDFQDSTDRLWLVGDLVNRGPQSLQVLRFLRALKIPPIIVLGNHDLHLLAVACGAVSAEVEDTFGDVLQASDSDALCAWLAQQKMFHYDPQLNFALVHAGVPPQWDVQQALQYAHEVETVLRSQQASDFFARMYGDQPDKWDESLQGYDRLRLITNYLTRMRLCGVDGCLYLKDKVALRPTQKAKPWFSINQRNMREIPIIYGHWAALRGKTQEPNAYPLDTGCVWGGSLTALRLEDKKRFTVAGMER